MAPRANWKGFLKLSLVTCPVALFPATSETEKVTFNQINKQTGHRIKYTKVDAETGDEVPSEDIIKGYKVDTDTYVTVDKDELENIALESARTIDIDEFVPRSTNSTWCVHTTSFRTARSDMTPTRSSARPSAQWTRWPSPG
jgi:DNA end-binding protein Ku